jgi:hypothetical protein
MRVALTSHMRQFPRPGRVVHRLGNDLPDVSGEIDVRKLEREPLARPRLAEGTGQTVIEPRRTSD